MIRYKSIFFILIIQYIFDKCILWFDQYPVAGVPPDALKGCSHRLPSPKIALYSLHIDCTAYLCCKIWRGLRGLLKK